MPMVGGWAGQVCVSCSQTKQRPQLDPSSSCPQLCEAAGAEMTTRFCLVVSGPGGDPMNFLWAPKSISEFLSHQE